MDIFNNVKGAGLALALAALPVAQAQAAFVMTLDDLGDAATPTIIYDGSGSDLGGPAGVITYSGAVGSFMVNVTTGVSKPVIGPARMDLNSINVSGSSAGTLVVSLTDTDFSGDYSAYTADFGGTTDGSVALDFLFDSGNSEFGGSSFASGSSAGSGAFPDSLTGAVAGGEPFSLTITATIEHDEASQISSFDAVVAPVPVPAAFWLFGSALAGFAAFRRRQQRA